MYLWSGLFILHFTFIDLHYLDLCVCVCVCVPLYCAASWPWMVWYWIQMNKNQCYCWGPDAAKHKRIIVSHCYTDLHISMYCTLLENKIYYYSTVMQSKKWIFSHDEFKVSSAQIAHPHFHSKIGPALLRTPAPSGSLLEIIMQMTVRKCFALQHQANLHRWCSASFSGVTWIKYTTLNSITKQAWARFNSTFIFVLLHIWLYAKTNYYPISCSSICVTL